MKCPFFQHSKSCLVFARTFHFKAPGNLTPFWLISATRAYWLWIQTICCIYGNFYKSIIFFVYIGPSWIEFMSLGLQSQRWRSLWSGSSVSLPSFPTRPHSFPVVRQGSQGVFVSQRRRVRLKRCRRELRQTSGILRHLSLPPSNPWHVGHIGQGGQGEVGQGGWQGPQPPRHCAVRCSLVQIQVWGEKWADPWKRESISINMNLTNQGNQGHLRAKTSAPVTRILPMGPKLPGEGTFSRKSVDRRSPYSS